MVWPEGNENWSGACTVVQQCGSSAQGRLRPMRLLSRRNIAIPTPTATVAAATATILAGPPKSSSSAPSVYQAAQPSPPRVAQVIQTRIQRGAGQRFTFSITLWSPDPSTRTTLPASADCRSRTRSTPVPAQRLLTAVAPSAAIAAPRELKRRCATSIGRLKSPATPRSLAPRPCTVSCESSARVFSPRGNMRGVSNSAKGAVNLIGVFNRRACESRAAPAAAGPGNRPRRFIANPLPAFHIPVTRRL